MWNKNEHNIIISFSLKSNWLQYSIYLPGSFRNSSWFQQCCGLDCFDSYSDVQFPWSLFQAFLDHFKGFNIGITLREVIFSSSQGFVGLPTRYNQEDFSLGN